MPSEALDYITIKGFKSIRSIEKLELKPVNVLIGANGSGKSNFISVFTFLNAIREGRLQDYVRTAGGAEQILHFGSKVTAEVVLHISFGGGVNGYEVTLRPTADDSLFVAQESAYFRGQGYKAPYAEGLLPQEGGKEAGIGRAELPKVGQWVQRRLELFRLYHVHDSSATSPMRKPHRSMTIST